MAIATLPKIFFLLKDPSWDGLKPEKIYLFPKSYLTDGSKELLEDVAGEGLEYMRKSMVYSEEFPFFYWTYQGKGSFIDSFVTADLFADSRSFTAFRTWFELTVSNWCNANKLTFKIERDKSREYFIKITVTVTPIPVGTTTGTVSTTSIPAT